MTFKKIVGWLHLWLGLASGIIVFILSVTGCILVFEQEIRNVTSPWLHAEIKGDGSYIRPSVIYDSASRAMPGKKIFSVWYHGHGHTAHVRMDSDTMLYVNPYTAEVIAMIDHEDFFHIVEEGHFWLWLPQEIGHAVTGWGTFIFFILLVTGLILWWPKKWSKSNRDKSFKIKWSARWKRVNYDLHNVLGFYSLAVAVVLAFTGLMMSFAWFNNSVYWLSSGGEARPPRVQAYSDTTLVPQYSSLANSDRAWKKGLTELGQYNKDQIIIGFPEKASDGIYVCTDMVSGDWRDIYLDQNTLEILPSTDQARSELNVANWIARSNYGLHVGAIGGLTTKIIYFLVSLVCATLPITGFLVWWQRGKKTKQGKDNVSRVKDKKRAEKLMQ